MLIQTREMHTGGEPLRIIEKGFPEVHGSTLLEKRKYVREHLDHLRLLLMHEPRGHHDMYGALLVEPDHPEAHLAVLFMHNEGYSTMCGHAVIALARYAVDVQKVPRTSGPETEVIIQCPCGLVKAFLDNKTGDVRFESICAFSALIDQRVTVDGYGSVVVDIGFGGAFYAILPSSRLSVDLHTAPAHDLICAATAVSNAVKKQVSLTHPESSDLAFLYGTILTDGKDEYDEKIPTSNFCVFADKEVDRCPTGSGVTARIAVQYTKGQVKLGQSRTFVCSATGSRFRGRALRDAKCGDVPGVIVEVSGKAHYTGSATFMLEQDDPFPTGFLLK